MIRRGNDIEAQLLVVMPSGGSSRDAAGNWIPRDAVETALMSGPSDEGWTTRQLMGSAAVDRAVALGFLEQSVQPNLGPQVRVRLRSEFARQAIRAKLNQPKEKWVEPTRIHYIDIDGCDHDFVVGSEEERQYLINQATEKRRREWLRFKQLDKEFGSQQ